MATDGPGTRGASLAGGTARRRALLGSPLLCASAPTDPKQRYVHRPLVDPVPQDFLDGVR